MHKQELLQRFKVELERMLTEAEQSRDEAQAESNRHVGKMESRYDTFKEESQTLADNFEGTARSLRGSLKQLEAHQASVATSDTIEPGALFTVEQGGDSKNFLMFESGGGINLYESVVITPQSPLGALFVGKKSGDVVIFEGGGGKQEYRITHIE